MHTLLVAVCLQTHSPQNSKWLRPPLQKLRVTLGEEALHITEKCFNQNEELEIPGCWTIELQEWRNNPYQPIVHDEVIQSPKMSVPHFTSSILILPFCYPFHCPLSLPLIFLPFLSFHHTAGTQDQVKDFKAKGRYQETQQNLAMFAIKERYIQYHSFMLKMWCTFSLHSHNHRAMEVVELFFNFRFYIRLKVLRTSLNHLHIATYRWICFLLQSFH